MVALRLAYALRNSILFYFLHHYCTITVLLFILIGLSLLLPPCRGQFRRPPLHWWFGFERETSKNIQTFYKLLLFVALMTNMRLQRVISHFLTDEPTNSSNLLCRFLSDLQPPTSWVSSLLGSSTHLIPVSLDWPSEEIDYLPGSLWIWLQGYSQFPTGLR